MRLPPHSIFISYARTDGRALARRLRTELESLGFTLWQDVVDMEPGEQWRPQLEEAIERSAAMVLVLTDAALLSRVVREEWTYARTVGTHVLPVVETAEVIGKAPEWARKLDIVNLDPGDADRDIAWKRFVALLRNPPARRPRPFVAPELPPHFVQRPREFTRIVEHVLDADRAAPLALTTALQGGGGFGKTTLAIALCHEPRVRAAFDGGILWVQFTPNTSPADALALLNDQIRLLDPDGPTFSEPTLASARFRELLSGRDVLVVLDDVWSESYLPLFLHKGPTYVITTRLQPIVAKAGADHVLVEQLEPEEAADLLSRSLSRKPGEDEGPLLRDLALRLGEWALLVTLVGAELRALTAGGRTLAEAVAYVIQRLERRGFSYLDRHQEGNRNVAVGDSLDASLMMLDPAQRQRFHELGILQGDIDLSFETIGQLWAASADYDSLETEDALEAMQRLALFTRYDAQSRTFRLHEVIGKVLASRLTDAAALHSALIAQWGDLRRLPDDYAWKNVLFHLRRAGRQADVRRLLFDFDWIHAKLHAAGPVSVIADYQSETGDADCRLLASALTMAGASLSDPTQLPTQLVGRLAHLDGTSAAVKTLLTQAGTHDSTPALLPKRVFLPSIAQGVHRTIQVGERILSGALTADGVHLLIGLVDGTVQIWDWRRQERIGALGCGVGPVLGMEVSGEQVAVGGYHDHWTGYAPPAAPVEVWNWRSRQRLHTVATDLEDVRNGFAVALRSGLAALTTGESNNLVHLYDWTTNTLVAVVNPQDIGMGSYGNRPGIPALAGPFLLYHDSTSSRIDVWTVAERRYCGSTSGEVGWGAAAFVADGRLCVRTRWTDRPADARGFLYRLAADDQIAGVEVRHYDPAVSAVTSRGPHLFVCSAIVQIRETESEEVVGLLEAHSSLVVSIDLVEDAVITTSVDGTIRIWDWPPAVETRPDRTFDEQASEQLPRFYQPPIEVIQVSGASAFVGTREGSIEEWSWETAAMQTVARQGRAIHALAVNETWLAFSSFERVKHGVLRARRRNQWNVDRRPVQWREETGFSVSNGLFDFNERGAMSATLLGDSCAAVIQSHYTPANSIGGGRYTGNRICVIDLRRETCEMVVGEWISAVALSPGLVAGGTAEGHIDLWERAAPHSQRRLGNHSGGITALAFGNDHLISGSSDGTVQIWDLAAFASIYTLRLAGPVHALSVRDGLLVTASEDHTLRLFDWRRGTQLACFTDDAALVACEIADDAATILGGGMSGQLHILRANASLHNAISGLADVSY